MVGLIFVAQWVMMVRSPVRSVRELRLEFATKIYFARKISADAQRTLLKKQLAVCEERYKRLKIEMESCRTDIERQVLDFRVTMVTASIDWLGKLLAKSRATQGETEGL